MLSHIVGRGLAPAEIQYTQYGKIAQEFKSEGLVLGLGAKMFTIAGPVLVYGILASVVYGVGYWICQMVEGG